MSEPEITQAELLEGERLYAERKAVKFGSIWRTVHAWTEWAVTKAPKLLAEVRRLQALPYEMKRPHDQN